MTFSEFVRDLLDTFDDAELNYEREPQTDPQTGFVTGEDMTPLCERCEERLRLPNEDYCETCRDNLAEAAYERSQDECFRGGEAAAFGAEEQARIQRELK